MATKKTATGKSAPSTAATDETTSKAGQGAPPSSAKKASPAKATAKKASPAKATAKKASPAKATAKKASPAKATAKKASPAKATAKKASPAKPAANKTSTQEAPAATTPAEKPGKAATARARSRKPPSAKATKTAAPKPATETAKKPAARKSAAAKAAEPPPASAGAAKPARTRKAPAFSIGDKVVHPQHGAAVITKKTRQEVAGVKQEYFVLEIATDQLTVFVPVANIDETIRPVISQSQARKVFAIFKEPPQEAGSNWSRWYKVLNEKMTSGDIYQVAEVVRDLTYAQQTKGISPALKRMLSKARLTLTSELSFALNVDDEEATRKLDRALPKVEATETL